MLYSHVLFQWKQRRLLSFLGVSFNIVELLTCFDLYFSYIQNLLFLFLLHISNPLEYKDIHFTRSDVIDIQVLNEQIFWEEIVWLII